jgi:TrpR-related protein YerC/YecD
MADTERHPWHTREMKELLDAMWSLKDRAELQDFLRDLCTLGELEAMSHRWAVARELDRGLPYLEVAAKTGASTTTVSRVAQWLHHGQGGYRVALDRLAAERRRNGKTRA